ncbi:MAG: cell division protein FtsQ/DivIB [Pseudanabaenaceae cyanobacterium]
MQGDLSVDKPSQPLAQPLSYAQRRKQRRRDRRNMMLLRIWQLISISAITGGLVWVAARPEWQLRSNEQITIQGNRLLSRETLRRMVVLPYPLSIFQVQPQTVATQIERTAPVSQVIVTRTIFPAMLTIQVQERLPVATLTRNNQPGFLDVEGVWMPQSAYPASFNKPSLNVLESNNRPISQWTSLYKQVIQSQIKTSQIDWRDDSNLILHTDLGKVHFGIYDPRLFPKQLETLDRLRTLPKSLKDKPFTHIDVTDPSAPLVEMPLDPNSPNKNDGNKVDKIELKPNSGNDGTSGNRDRNP